MNRIEGPLVKDDQKVDPNSSKKKLREAASSLIKTEIYQPSITKEHLGRVIVEKESHVPKSTVNKNRLKDLSANKIDTMPRAELIRLSATIEVDGTNLRQIYETKLLGENGLRRLVKEYAIGGDLKKILRQEILEREIDFEKDPVTKDISLPTQHPAEASSAPTVAGASTINDLLKKAEESISGSSEEAAFYRAKADYEIKQIASQHKRSRRIDYLMAGIISLLFIAILIMFLTRS